MGDDLRKVRPGEPLRVPARAYNAFVDAALDLKRRQQDRFSGDLRDGGRQHGVVPVRNDTGSDLERYHVMAIDGPLFPPGDEGPEHTFQNRMALKGIEPNEETPPGRFVVAREPIPAGELGLCVIHGATPARLYVEEEEHTFADIKPGERVLVSGGSGGTAILWKEDGVGEKWAVVDIGRPRSDKIVAILGEATEIEGERFRWRYPWDEAAIDGEPGSDTFGRYIKVENGLSSDGDPDKYAINRFESHHSDVPDQDPEGTDGFGALKSLFIPGQLENPGGDQGYCPRKAAIPILRPILKNVAVQMTAERDTRGGSVWCFQALNGIELVEYDVPVWLYV